MDNSKKTKKPLSKALKTFYGVGDCAFSLMTSVENYFFPFFLTNLAQFDLGLAALIQTITSGVDAAISWIYGAIIDGSKPMKWGRYRSWLIALPWIVPLLYALQFVKFGNNAINAVTIIIGFLASHMIWNIPYVANVSLITLAAQTPEDRSQLTATRGAWANMSRVLFPYVGIPMASFFAGIIGETNQYAATAFVLGVIMAVMYYAHFKMFDGYEDVDVVTDVKSKKADKMSGGDMLKSLFQNPPLLVLLIADVSKFLFNFLLGGIAVYYFTYVAQNAALLPTYIFIANILGVIGSYVSKNFAKTLSTRTAAIVFFVITAAVLIVAKLLWASVSVYVVIILLSIGQFSYGVNYSLIPALYADCVIYSEWKTGKKASGWIMGLQNLPLKVSILLRGLIISAVLASANFTPDIDPAQASDALKNAITNGFMLIPAIFSLVSAVLLVVGFKITREKVVEYQEEINSRTV